MRKIGLRILQLSGIILFVSIAATFLDDDVLASLGLAGELLANSSSITLLGVVVGAVIYLLNRSPEPHRTVNSKATFWIGVVLIASGLLPLGYFAYQAFFVPTMAYLVLALVGFGPVFLILIGLGAYLVIRSRRQA